MSVLVGKKAPKFNSAAVVNGSEIVEDFSLEQYVGKKYVIFTSIRPILLSCVPQK